MSVATMNKTRKNKIKNPGPHPEQKSLLDEQEKQDDRQELMAILQASVMEVTMEVNWFSRNKKIDSNTVKEILQAYAEKKAKAAEAAGKEKKVQAASSKSVGMTKTIFNSGHPIVKKANESRRVLEAYRDSMTSSAAAFAASKMTDKEAEELLKKDAGVRFIELDRVEEFDAQCQVLAENVIAAVNDINDHMEEIKEFDKKELGDDLFKPDDYPDSVSAQIRGPDYKQVGYSIDFQKAAPKAFERAQERAYQRLADSVDITINDTVDSLSDLFKLIMGQLANRVRLKPPQGHEMAFLRDAEVVEKKTRETDPDVEEGKVEILVSYKKPGAKRQSQEWLELTPTEYAELRPAETNERRKFYDSSVDNFREKLTRLKNTTAILGDQSKPLIEILDKLDDSLRSVGSTTKEISASVREVGFVRKTLQKSVQEAATALASFQTTLVAYKGRRRAIGRLKDKVSAAEE